LGVAGLTLLGATARAVYLPSQLPDPSRRWSISVALQEGYNDNTSNSSDHRRGSSYTRFEPKLYLNYPMDQTFLGLRYTYQLYHFPNRVDSGQVDQNHILDLLYSHRFTPRLTLDVNDSLRRGIAPELTSTIGGVERIERSRGDYWFNALSGGLTYSASHRWTLALSQAWETWRYDEKDIADGSDHDGFTTSASATYTLDPVSSVGLNARYSCALYRKPGDKHERNSQSEAVFLSYTHLFTPVLGLNLAGGASFNEFGDDHHSTSPYFSLSLSYTYLPDCTLSFIAGYSFYDTDVTGYRSSDSLSLSAQLAHRLSRKCRVTLSAAYIRSQYGNRTEEIIGGPSDPADNAVRVGLSASYGFTRWLSLDMSYAYERVWSDFDNRDYWRNSVGAGLRVTF
jgi:predicted porin